MKNFFLLVFLMLALSVLAQPPIPSTTPGHSIGPADAPVVIEAFYDFQCPDSQANWPVMKTLVAKYSSSIRFVLQHFPLPYHGQAFTAAVAAEAVNTLLPAAYFKYVDTLFDNQEQFYNAATFNKTQAQMNDLFTDFAKSVGVDPVAFQQMLSDSDLRYSVVIQWKFGAGSLFCCLLLRLVVFLSFCALFFRFFLSIC